MFNKAVVLRLGVIFLTWAQFLNSFMACSAAVVNLLQQKNAE